MRSELTLLLKLLLAADAPVRCASSGFVTAPGQQSIGARTIARCGFDRISSQDPCSSSSVGAWSRVAAAHRRLSACSATNACGAHRSGLFQSFKA